MRRLLLFILVLCVTLFPTIGFGAEIEQPVQLPEISEEYMVGTAIEVFEKEDTDDTGYTDTYQEVTVQITEGEYEGSLVYVHHGMGATLLENEIIELGDRVVVVQSQNGEFVTNYIADYYRLPALIWVGMFFVLLILVFGRYKGLSSLIGLGFSFLVLVKFIVPQIIAGASPFAVTLFGALLIMLVSMYLAHGFYARTTVALVSTMCTIVIALLLAVLFTQLANVFGTGSQDAYSLQFIGNIKINLEGLFLGGVIIGTLGVLDDITMSQAAVVDELKKVDSHLRMKELYAHAISVGQEHIASLVNTLALAYAGAALPIFIIFAVNESQPLFVLLNSEFVAEELIRTLVGSSALVLAVPITTFFAATYFNRHPSKHDSKSGHVCRH